MLGLANTVSSSSTLDSLYSITLDGTDDYINLGNVLNLGQGDFTISMWVYVTEAASNIFLSKYQDANNYWAFKTQGDGQVQFEAKINGSAICDQISAADGILSENQWVHIAHTNDRSETEGEKIYINGTLSRTGGQGSTDDIDNTGSLYIGRVANQYAESGTKIDEVSIWTAALDGETIAAIYTKGGQHDLAAGRTIGTTPLAAYYRMGNGKFDDKKNGAIHDQNINSSYAGFGSDVVTDGDFPSLDNWDKLNEDGANQVTLVDGTAKITYDTSVGGALGISQTNILTSGKTYMVTMDVVSISGNGVKIYSGNEHAASIGTGPHKSYFVADGVDFRIFRNSAGASSVTTVDNIVIRQLNGLPGLTSGGPTFTSDVP